MHKAANSKTMHAVRFRDRGMGKLASGRSLRADSAAAVVTAEPHNSCGVNVPSSAWQHHLSMTGCHHGFRILQVSRYLRCRYSLCLQRVDSHGTQSWNRSWKGNRRSDVRWYGSATAESAFHHHVLPVCTAGEERTELGKYIFTAVQDDVKSFAGLVG